jgi:hypothetical protein
MLYQQTLKTLSRHWRLAYIGLAASIAVFYDIFFWDVALGLGFLIFVLLYLIGFISLTVATNQLREPRAFLFLVPVFVLSVDIFLYNNDLVHTWVPLFVFVLLVLFSLTLTLRNPHKYKFSFLKIPLFRDIDILFTKWGAVFTDLFTWEKGERGKSIKKIVIGLGISIPILLIFGSLLAEADVIFNDILSNVFDTDLKLTHAWRLFRTGIITLFLSGFFYVLIQSNVLGEKKDKAIKLDSTVVGTILVLMNVLFLFFVAVQFKYLFGPYEYVRANEIIFAEYARSGFFQLAWVVGLAAAMLVFMYRSAVHHGYSKLLQALKVVFIALVLVIAYSALHRMELYQEAYGFTVKRLYVEWVIYFAMLIFLFAAGSIITKLKFRTFLYTVLMLGVVAMTAVSSINVDRIIAQENIARFISEGKDLDVKYLSKLSIDVAPAFDSVLDYSIETDIKQNSIMKDILSLRTSFLKEVESAYSWRSFNIGRIQARQSDLLSSKYLDHIEKLISYLNDDYHAFSEYRSSNISRDRSLCSSKGNNIKDVSVCVAYRSKTLLKENDPLRRTITTLRREARIDTQKDRHSGEYDLYYEVWQYGNADCRVGSCLVEKIFIGSTDDGIDDVYSIDKNTGYLVRMNKTELTYSIYALRTASAGEIKKHEVKASHTYKELMELIEEGKSLPPLFKGNY